MHVIIVRIHCVLPIFFLFIFILSVPTVAQNLVPNFSFEEFTKCPGDFSQRIEEFRVKDWQSASLGTPDHFHSCSNGEADVPHNWAGVSDAYEGNGYAGIYVWVTERDNYREYLHCKLLEPLIKDSIYILEFHYKLSSYSKYSIDRIGLLLTESPLKSKHDRTLGVSPTLSVIHDSALTVKTGYWEKARMEYAAQGGEQYVTIGNFFDDGSTKTYNIKHRPAQQIMLAGSSYYYIDAVSVIPKYIVERNILAQVVPDFPEEAPALNTTYILKNINFEFDSYRLLSSSFEQLDKVVMWMEDNPNVKVVLAGHTDDVGGERYNSTLSRNRAKTVAAYLISRGIDARRIEALGYGKSKPLVEGTSQEARSVNRRVEIKFVQ